MDKLSPEDKLEIKKLNKQTRKQEKKVSKYMNNIVKYNTLMIYHSSKNKKEFTEKCMLMFKNYPSSSKSTIKVLCNELYNIFKNYEKGGKPSTTSTKKIKHLNKLIENSINGKKSKKLLKGGEATGPYLQRLTTKGDKPITGDDMAKVVEEITTLLDDVQYLDDAPNVKGFNALFKYFNGDPMGLKQHLRYSLGPQFYSTFPPMIHVSKIMDRWDNIVDLLNAYKNDRKIKLQFAVEKGLQPSDVLQPTFLDKFADKLDAFDQKFQKARMASKGRFIV